mmetsp:Transcript_94480/g.282052  ORF Transcript_94480/g.282052 Transcript_94480/m.282052 type:complete len:413 (-) Transcript_94480:468-1706(-)
MRSSESSSTAPRRSLCSAFRLAEKPSMRWTTSCRSWSRRSVSSAWPCWSKARDRPNLLPSSCLASLSSVTRRRTLDTSASRARDSSSTRLVRSWVRRFTSSSDSSALLRASSTQCRRVSTICESSASSEERRACSSRMLSTATLSCCASSPTACCRERLSASEAFCASSQRATILRTSEARSLASTCKPSWSSCRAAWRSASAAARSRASTATACLVSSSCRCASCAVATCCSPVCAREARMASMPRSARRQASSRSVVSRVRDWRRASSSSPSRSSARSPDPPPPSTASCSFWTSRWQSSSTCWRKRLSSRTTSLSAPSAASNASSCSLPFCTLCCAACSSATSLRATATAASLAPTSRSRAAFRTPRSARCAACSCRRVANWSQRKPICMFWSSSIRRSKSRSAPSDSFT